MDTPSPGTPWPLEDGDRAGGGELPSTALAAYRRQERWLEKVDPETFLAERPEFLHLRESPAGDDAWKSRWAPPLVGLAAAAVLLVIVLGDWRIKRFLAELFHEPPPPPLTEMADNPTPLPEKDIPVGLREAVARINRELEAKQWSEAVKAVTVLSSDEANVRLLQAKPEALLWTNEVLVAGRVAQKAEVNEAIRAYEKFRRANPALTPSFRLRYGYLNARFLSAGGTGPIKVEKVDESERLGNRGLLQELRDLRNQFGTFLSKEKSRMEKLRVIEAFTLARTVSGLTNKELAGPANASSEPAQHFDELYTLLEEWRQTVGANELKWPEELLVCEQWFWGRASAAAHSHIPFRHGEATIGKRTYQDASAGESHRAAEKALAAQQRK